MITHWLFISELRCGIPQSKHANYQNFLLFVHSSRQRNSPSLATSYIVPSFFRILRAQSFSFGLLGHESVVVISPCHYYLLPFLTTSRPVIGSVTESVQILEHMQKDQNIPKIKVYPITINDLVHGKDILQGVGWCTPRHSRCPNPYLLPLTLIPLTWKHPHWWGIQFLPHHFCWWLPPSPFLAEEKIIDANSTLWKHNLMAVQRSQREEGKNTDTKLEAFKQLPTAFYNIQIQSHVKHGLS